MIILGLSGKARTGKSTACRYLYDAAQDAGWTVKVKPFAGPLKEHVQNVLGFTKENNPQEYRTYCQSEGARMRAENPDHWINLWYQSMVNEYHHEMSESSTPVLYLVDDLRYPNELDLINKLGGVSVFVKHGDRPIEDPEGEWRKHESEVLCNKCEYIPDDNLVTEVGYAFVMHNDKGEECLPVWAKRVILDLSNPEPCGCETCCAMRENREPDVKKQLDDFNKWTEGECDDE